MKFGAKPASGNAAPVFEHHEDREPDLMRGFTEVTLPTQLPSQSLADIMGHRRREATRADCELVQDIGPRLQQNGGDNKDYSNYEIDYMDTPSKASALKADVEYAEEYVDPKHETDSEDESEP